MKVLVAIDNRPSSQAIIDALIKMHWYEGTEIDLVTVLPPDNESGVAGATHEQMEDLAVEMRQSLRDCEVAFFARSGDPKTVILDLAEQRQSDLIVVGCNCKSSLERMLLGSVTQSVLNTASVPVIVAKTPCCLARDASPSFRNILVPIDNSIFSDASVQWLANFRWGPKTQFVVAAVVADDTDLVEVKESLNRRAYHLSRLLKTQNVLIEIATGEPHQAIVELAKKHYSDLILMGSHGHTGLKHLILGSVSQAVSHNAPCAVAIVRGLAKKDSGWHHTGHFSKVNLAALAAASNANAPVSAPRTNSSKRDLNVNIMPGGF